MAIEPRFQAAGEFRAGLARVHQQNKAVYTQGEYTSDDATEYAFKLREDDLSELPGCFPKGGTFGFVDKTGTFIIPSGFFIASDFSEGLAAVRVEESVESKYGYI